MESTVHLPRCAVPLLERPDSPDQVTLVRSAIKELVTHGVYRLEPGSRPKGLLRRAVPMPVLVRTEKAVPPVEPLVYVDETIQTLPEKQHGDAHGRSLFAYAKRVHQQKFASQAGRRTLAMFEEQGLVEWVERPPHPRIRGNVPPMLATSDAGRQALAALGGSAAVPEEPDSLFDETFAAGYKAGTPANRS